MLDVMGSKLTSPMKKNCQKREIIISDNGVAPDSTKKTLEYIGL